MDDILTLGLALAGAAIAAFIPGLPVGVGWFIGMSVGQLLSLESETAESGTVGPRRTEFRGLFSKFGTVIPKGYGTVRLNGNVIWASPVLEELHIERNCVSQQTGGFFGLFDKEQTTCSNVATYHYKQSFAVAFAQGPATAYVRVWAQGTLLYDNSASNITQDASDAALTGRPESVGGPATLVETVQLSEFFTVTTTPSLRFYYGTSDQSVDPIIAEDVGAANCPAFRNTVYLLINDLDLERWGYRIPEITAEITFEGGGVFPSHVVKGRPGDPAVSYNRWATEVPPDGNDIIAVQLQDDNPTWSVIDVYQGDFTRHFEWLPIITQALGSVPNITAQGPEMGKVDSNGLWYWTGLVSGADVPMIIQYDPINGAIQQIDVNTFTTFVRYVSHMLHDKTRGLTYCVSSILGGFGAIVSDRTAFAIRNNMVVPEEDDTIQLFQIYLPYADYEMNGSMAMDKDGIVWLGNGSSANPLYRYDPDINVVEGLGELWDNTQSPAVQILSITGVCYSWQDETLVMAASFDSPGTPAGLIKYDIATRAITLSNPSANTGWPIDHQSNFSKAPFDGGQYIYQTGVGLYLQMDVFDLSVTEYGFGDWEIANNPLSGPWIPQVRGWLSTGVQQISYLRAGGEGVGLDEVVSDLILKDDVLEDRYGITSADIDVSDLASRTVRGYAITSQQSIRGAIVPLQQSYFFDYVESDAILLFRLRGRSSIVTIPEDDLAAHEYGTTPNERIKITYREELELPRELAINYIDADRAYEQGTQRYRRLKTNASSNTTITLPIVFSANEAQEIAEVLHTNSWAEREVFTFALGPKYMYLDPTDNITVLLDDGSIHFCRLTKTVIGRNGIVLCEAVSDATSLYTAPNAVGVPGGYVPAPFVYNPFTLNPVTPALPPLNTFNDDYNLYIGMTGYDAGGIFQPVDVYVAEAGQPARFVGSIDTLTSSGTIDTEVEHPDTPNGFYGAIDSTQTITLIQPPGEGPSSVTEDQLFTGSNWAVMGDEVLGFQTVTVNSPDNGTYVLSNIIRGLNGTDHNVDRHKFPEPFVLVDNLLTVPMSEENLNQIINIILRPKGSNDITLEVIEYQGASAAPLAPTNPQVTSSGSPEDYVVTWTRRDRVYGAWSTEGDIPNSETIEQYELDIMDRDGNVLRTLSATDTTTVTYTNAQMVTDFGSVPPTIYGILFQMSSTVGRGFPRRFVARPSGEYYFRKFDGDLASPVTTPANVSQRWVTSGYTYNVESETSSDYGAVLHLDTSTDGRHLLSFDDLGELRDVELLIRFKVPAFGAASGGAGPRFIFRGRGAAATEKGLYLGINADGSAFNLNKFNNGTAVAIGTATNISSLPHLAGFSSSLQDDIWYRCRLRSTGWRYKFKIWRDDTNEPGVWSANYYDSMTHEYGWTGFGGFESYIDVKIDWIYAAINGKRAG